MSHLWSVMLKSDKTLFVGSCVALVVAVGSSTHGVDCIPKLISTYNDIVVNLSSGFVLSVIFYFLVVRLPERRRNRRLATNLERSFGHLRHTLSVLILRISSDEPDDSHFISKIETPDGFRKHFTEDHWNGFLNRIDKRGILEIKHHLRSFQEELHFTVSHMNIDRGEVFDLLKNLSSSIIQMDLYGVGYDDEKEWGRFLWSLLTNWDWAEGYMISGPIEKAIRELKQNA